MKNIILVLFISLLSCNNAKKKESKQETYKDQMQKQEVAIQELSIVSIENWDLRGVSLSETGEYFNNEKVYNINVNDEADSYAFAAINSIKLNYTGGRYRISMIVKKGEVGNRLGLRIQEFYPVRTDIVYDLEKQKVLDVFKEEDLTSDEKASIELLENGWYKCSLVTDIYASYFRLVFGPSDNSKAVKIWESLTEVENKNDLLFIPSSIKIEELE